jgi:bifunctional non-homologous end joining protein LigD
VPDEPQLPLSISPATARLPARLVPMQPETAIAPFDDAGYLFEPWWPGVRGIAYVEGGRTRLAVEGLTDADAAFPEVGIELPERLRADGVIMDGFLVVLDREGRLDPALLRARLAGGRRGGRAAFVASDLPWCDGTEWTRRRFATRRERLEAVLEEGDRCVVGRAFRTDGTLLAEALRPMGIPGMSARRLDARYRAGNAGDAWLRVPIVADAPPAEPPRLALIQRLPLDRD